MSDPVRVREKLVPVAARPPLLDGAVAAGEALQIILFEALSQVGANVPVVLETEAGEGLHQLRVGLRRLRTALTITETPELAALDARAKAFINTIGPARDLDVFLDELFRPAVAKLGARRGFEILETRALRLRDAAWTLALAEVSSPSFRDFQDAVVTAARQSRWCEGATAAAAAPVLLDGAFKRARRRGRHFSTLEAPERHRLRIALKKLRYAAEFFAPLYADKAVAHWLEPLKDLQDVLGHLNDVALLRSVVGRLMMEEADAAVQADLSHAAGLLQGWHQARGERLLAKANKRWKAFRQTEPFWV